MKRRKSLILALISAIVVSVSAVVAFSYASYVYNHRFESPVEFNTGLLKSYFAGGEGTSNDPYVIEEPIHLRNLQKLNVFGVFSENTHFKLSDNIPTAGMNYEGDDLFPIGSEDNPFYSQFDGNGKRINALVVNGSQTSDIGMFGYTAMNSMVKNFVLSAPTIKVTSDNNPNSLSNANPMAPLFANATEGAPSLQLTLTVKSGQTPAYFTTNKSSLVGSNGVTYEIHYKSSDESLLSFNENNDRWSVSTPSGAKDGEFFPVQLTARVYGVYQNMIISYLLERWHINVTHDNNVNIENTAQNIHPGHWKTIHATANEGAGPHGTYVGFFIGHSDGDAEHLGLYGGTSSSQAANAKLIVEGRQVSSFLTLIGRSVNDNVRDDANATFAHRYFDFNEIINEAGAPVSPKIDPVNFTLPANPTAHGQIANYFTTINTRATNISKYYGLSNDEVKYIRFYPTLSNGSATFNELDENNNPISVTKNTLSFSNKPLKGLVYNKKGGFLNLQRVNQDYALHNALWIYMTTDNIPGGFGGLFSRHDKRFEIKLTITYIASSSSLNNNFQILFNGYKPTGGLFAPNLVQSTNWQDLATQTDDEGTPLFVPSQHPLIPLDENNNPMQNQVVTQEINFSIHTNAMGVSGDYHTMIGFGVGKTRQGAVIYNSTNDDNYMSTVAFNHDNFDLQILDVDLFFTSKSGEYARQINNVDYIYSIPTYSNGTWSNWNRASGVNVYFDVDANILTPGRTATYRFYRSSGGTFQTSRVYGYYDIPSGMSWQLRNKSGYAQATLASG